MLHRSDCLNNGRASFIFHSTQWYENREISVCWTLTQRQWLLTFVKVHIQMNRKHLSYLLPVFNNSAWHWLEPHFSFFPQAFNSYMDFARSIILWNYCCWMPSPVPCLNHGYWVHEYLPKLLHNWHIFNLSVHNSLVLHEPFQISQENCWSCNCQ